jgi:hypothetical protein
LPNQLPYSKRKCKHPDFRDLHWFSLFFKKSTIFVKPHHSRDEGGHPGFSYRQKTILGGLVRPQLFFTLTAYFRQGFNRDFTLTPGCFIRQTLFSRSYQKKLQISEME